MLQLVEELLPACRGQKTKADAVEEAVVDLSTLAVGRLSTATACQGKAMVYVPIESIGW